MSDIIDINVGETIEEVTINVVDNLITVNINKVTGGGGSQTLAETLVLGNITDGENISISNGDAIVLDNGSMLKKGTIDAGNGGAKGISQICGVGFEHKWEAGRLYIMNDGGTIIREVSHNLTYTPTATDDVTKGFVQNTRWILDNGDVYVCSDPTEDAAVWELVNTGTTPTLQQVTDEGNETSNSIIVTDNSENQTALQYNGINFNDLDEGGNTLLRFINTSAASQEIEIRGLGGTMALLSDIPTLVAGTNITIDDTDPLNPIISSTGGGGGGGGGASISFYLNGSVSQGTIGGIAFREMDRTPILGAGTDFTINANGYIQSFITDANVPNLLEIPAGNWNFETYFSASSGGGSPSFYVELYKWDGTTLSLIASNSATPEGITNGTAIDAYFSALAVPQTTLAATDRLAIRIYVTHSGRTITLHTEDNHLCQIITTFSTGLTALNGLTAQVQNLAVGTSGTDFAISSVTDTHTFNLPTASATNRGALSSTDWSTFNGKQNALPAATTSVDGYLTATDWNTFNNKGYAINLGATSTTYLANNTYYFGIPTQAGTTASAQRKILIPKTGTIKGGQIYIRTSVGTTTENWTLSIRLNNTTNTTFATVATTALEKIFGTTSLNISVVAGDFIEIITSTPTWLTPPGASFIYGTIIIQ